MTGWLVVLVIVAFLVVIFLVALVGHIFAGFGEEIGSRLVSGLASAYRDGAAQRHANRLARSGHSAPEVLAVFGGTPGAEALSSLRCRFTPGSDTATFLSAVSGSTSPFAGRTAIVIAVGSATDAELSGLFDQTGRDVVLNVAMVATEGTTRPHSSSVYRVPGSVSSQLLAVVEWAEQMCASLEDPFLAVMVHPPISGLWEDGTPSDPQAVIEAFLSTGRDLWITVRDAAGSGSWPSAVTIEFPTAVTTIARSLKSASALTGTKLKRRSATLSLSGEQAAALIPLLVGLERMPMTAATMAPRFSPALTLALSGAAAAGQASVQRDSSEIDAIQAFLKACHVRLLPFPGADVELKMPLASYPIRTIAWHIAKAEPSPGPAGHGDDASPADVGSHWLAEAITSGDDGVAAAVLADHGRAWLELKNNGRQLELLQQVFATYPQTSLPYLWARYLLALDAALRLARPEEWWFDDETCEAAALTELGPLYRAERVEFRRLRGDLEGAVREAGPLLNELRSTAPDLSRAGGYVAGTARYVLANTLRHGGRYDMARGLIVEAASILDPRVPSHRIELTHAEYGLSVCDGMFGVASVSQSGLWSQHEAVFGRSLVTLANSHASWFVSDFERAHQFAEDARNGFASIGYGRYAARAARLSSLLQDWASRCGSPIKGNVVRDPSVDALLSTPSGLAVSFATDRPSRALSLLQFTRAFGETAEPREVELPIFVASEVDGGLVVFRPPPASSFAEAEQVIRTAIGVDSGSRVPLAVD